MPNRLPAGRLLLVSMASSTAAHEDLRRQGGRCWMGDARPAEQGGGAAAADNGELAELTGRRSSRVPHLLGVVQGSQLEQRRPGEAWRAD